jgi:hypothetical protein
MGNIFKNEAKSIVPEKRINEDTYKRDKDIKKNITISILPRSIAKTDAGDKNAINNTNTMALDRFNLEEKSRKPNIYNVKFTKPKYILVFCVKLNVSAKYCHILG